MQLSRKQKTFSHFFAAFLNSDLNFEHFQKKKIRLIRYVFPKLWILKNLGRSMSKNSGFKRSFGKQRGKRAQTSLKFPRQHLYHIYWSLWRQLAFNNYLLVTWKISRLFPNTLSADGRYSLLNRNNLTQTNSDASISKKTNFLSIFFCIFEM